MDIQDGNWILYWRTIQICSLSQHSQRIQCHNKNFLIHIHLFNRNFLILTKHMMPKLGLLLLLQSAPITVATVSAACCAIFRYLGNQEGGYGQNKFPLETGKRLFYSIGTGVCMFPICYMVKTGTLAEQVIPLCFFATALLSLYDVRMYLLPLREVTYITFRRSLVAALSTWIADLVYIAFPFSQHLGVYAMIMGISIFICNLLGWEGFSIFGRNL